MPTLKLCVSLSLCIFKDLKTYKKFQRTFFIVITECHIQAIPPQATHLSLDIL
jgi:hypothetical protein